jgi:hypothetical protein
MSGPVSSALVRLRTTRSGPAHLDKPGWVRHALRNLDGALHHLEIALALELFYVADDPAEILQIIKTAHAGMPHE